MTQDLGIGASQVSATVIVPRDRVRWGPIVAGVFAALCTLIVLSVLGVAVGATALEGDLVRNIGLGAGIWAGISALVAFFVGGWLAARSAAVRGHGNGTLNGAMVWVTAIPVMLFLLGGGLLAANTAVATGVPQGAQLGEEAQTATGQIAADGQAVVHQQGAQQQQQDLARSAGAAWGVLISMVLGLAAAAAGGYVGSRRDPYEPSEHQRPGERDLSASL